MIVVSTDSSKFDTQSLRELQNEVARLKVQDKLEEFCINHLKTEIQLLRDTLIKIKGEYKGALYLHEAMNEALNMQLKNGYRMKHNRDEIHYVGGHQHVSLIDTKRKR